MPEVIVHNDGLHAESVAPGKLVVAGWTDRDAAAVARREGATSKRICEKPVGTKLGPTRRLQPAGIRAANQAGSGLTAPLLQRTSCCSYGIDALPVIN